MNKLIAKEDITIGKHRIEKGKVLYRGMDYGFGGVGYFDKPTGAGGNKILDSRNIGSYINYFEQK